VFRGNFGLARICDDHARPESVGRLPVGRASLPAQGRLLSAESRAAWPGDASTREGRL